MRVTGTAPELAFESLSVLALTVTGQLTAGAAQVNGDLRVNGDIDARADITQENAPDNTELRLAPFGRLLGDNVSELTIGSAIVNSSVEVGIWSPSDEPDHVTINGNGPLNGPSILLPAGDVAHPVIGFRGSAAATGISAEAVDTIKVAAAGVVKETWGP